MTDKPTKPTKSNFDLDLHTYRLLQAEPFFSALSRRINNPKQMPYLQQVFALMRVVEHLK